MKYVSSVCLVAVMASLSGCGSSSQSASSGSSTGESIASGVNCSHVDTGAGTTLNFQYESVTYSNGDRFVSCYVGGLSAAFTDSHLYKSGQAGATTGGCSVGADLDTSTGGYWNFSSQSSSTKVTYSDTGSSHDGYTYTFASSDCTSF